MTITVQDMMKDNTYVKWLPTSILKTPDTEVSVLEKRVNALGFLILYYNAQTAGLLGPRIEVKAFLMGLAGGLALGLVTGIFKEILWPNKGTILKKMHDFAVCTTPIKNDVKCALAILTLLYSGAIAYSTYEKPEYLSFYNGAVIGLMVGYEVGSLKVQLVKNIANCCINSKYEEIPA